MVVTEEFFEENEEREQERYEELVAEGCSDIQARELARRDAQPPGLWVPLPESCFSCGEKLTVPFIFWESGQGIGLHIRCAAHLSVALYRDVIEYRSGREIAQHWYARAKKAAIETGSERK